MSNNSRAERKFERLLFNGLTCSFGMVKENKKPTADHFVTAGTFTYDHEKGTENYTPSKQIYDEKKA